MENKKGKRNGLDWKRKTTRTVGNVNGRIEKKLWNVRNAIALPFPPRKKEKDDGNGRRDGGNRHRRYKREIWDADC